jgi:hypothetical protein
VGLRGIEPLTSCLPICSGGRSLPAQMRKSPGRTTFKRPHNAMDWHLLRSFLLPRCCLERRQPAPISAARVRIFASGKIVVLACEHGHYWVLEATKQSTETIKGALEEALSAEEVETLYRAL